VSNNPFRYRGYYYDKDLNLYYLNARYYDQGTRRFVSGDSIGYLGANGDLISYNLYAYCGNNPVSFVDHNGHFVISLSSLLIGMVIGIAAGAVTSFGFTAYQDYKDDGEVFNGSIDFNQYAGNIVGGAIAGAGTGLCTVLGAAVGTAAFAMLPATILPGGINISMTSAIVLGISNAFVTGAAGYAARVGISKNESFNASEMIQEGSNNALMGAMSVFGGFLGGAAGLRTDLIPKAPFNKSNIIKRLFVENVFTGVAKRLGMKNE
jgi:RHS repeat-associated protein